MKRAAVEKIRTTGVWLRYKRLSKRMGRTDGLSVGHFRKGLRIGGCSNSRCWLCHAGKISGEPAVSARRSLATYREEMQYVLRSNSSLEHSREP